MTGTMVDVLIPTFNRADALAVTLTSLDAQTFKDFRVIVSDQGDAYDAADQGVVRAVVRVMQEHGIAVQIPKHMPRQGMAEQRQFLLDLATAPYVLFLDDDVILEPWVIENLFHAIRAEECGFVGNAVIGLSFLDDIRPHEQVVELWDGPVEPELIRPGTPAWDRYVLHNAANLYHVQQRLGVTPDAPKKYKVSWTGGCVLYDTRKLRSVGGFQFWKELPPNHCGEDVYAQMRVMACFGGCGLMPSGVYHQELPTTVHDRRNNAPDLLSFDLEALCVQAERYLAADSREPVEMENAANRRHLRAKV